MATATTIYAVKDWQLSVKLITKEPLVHLYSYNFSEASMALNTNKHRLTWQGRYGAIILWMNAIQLQMCTVQGMTSIHDRYR